MSGIKKRVAAFDRFQQRHRWLAFPVAVWKKFGDDQAGNLAALMAYYAFVSIFPLLLVLVTILGVFLRGDPSLQHKVLNSALANFPVIGDQLRANVHVLDKVGTGLAFGLVGVVLGSRGVATAAQSAFAVVWQVPRSRRPRFPASWLRGFGAIVVVGVGIIVTTTLSGFGGGVGGSASLGQALRWGALAVSLALNIGVFWVGFKLVSAKEVSWRDVRLGAVLSAVAWQILQAVGGYVVEHDLRHASSLYGLFGLVLGLLAWFYLQAELTMYALEASVVQARGLWPRSLLEDPDHPPALADPPPSVEPPPAEADAHDAAAPTPDAAEPPDPAPDAAEPDTPGAEAPEGATPPRETPADSE